jgi:hypothetical protein
VSEVRRDSSPRGCYFPGFGNRLAKDHGGWHALGDKLRVVVRNDFHGHVGRDVPERSPAVLQHAPLEIAFALLRRSDAKIESGEPAGRDVAGEVDTFQSPREVARLHPDSICHQADEDLWLGSVWEILQP